MPEPTLELLDRDSIYRDEIVQKLDTAGLYPLADKIRVCRTETLTFKCNACGRERKVLKRCRSRFCPMCAPAIAFRRAEEVFAWAKSLRQPKHVVLTIRNTQTLTQEMVRNFTANVRKLRTSRFSPRWVCGVWKTEVTNESKGWHLHAHLLVETRWVDPSRLSRRWARLVGQDFAIVKVKDARPAEYAREVTKYVAKPQDLVRLQPEDLATLVRAFSRSKVFGWFGIRPEVRARIRAEIDASRNQRPVCVCGGTSWTYVDPTTAFLHPTLD